MSLAMIVGSLIAGSTPLGGGAIAFPVLVLIVGFTPSQGRDYTILIQSTGMCAAAYVLVLHKHEQLHLGLILAFVVPGIPGVAAGLWCDVPSFFINIFYTTLVLEFALVLFYTKTIAPIVAAAHSSKEDFLAPTENKYGNTQSGALLAAVPLAFAGGFLTASVGMGSDLLLYSSGLFGWNLLVPSDARTDVSHTSSSVVVQASLSVIAAVLRGVIAGGFDTRVLQCWHATSCIVVLGAPLGSLLLAPRYSACLRGLFYCIAVLQFVSFVLLKMLHHVSLLLSIAVVTVTNAALLFAHYMLHIRPSRDLL